MADREPGLALHRHRRHCADFHDLDRHIQGGRYPLGPRPLEAPVQSFLLVGAIFGVAASLGIGVVQLNFGLNMGDYLAWLPRWTVR